MNALNFYCVPQILVQCGGVKELAQRVPASRALLIHNADAVADLIRDILTTHGVQVLLHRQRGEPTVEDVNAALSVCRQDQCETVVGIGGGSAIDLAKATAAIATNGGEALDYMEVVGRGRKITRDPLPWIAVPTTAGTGAEATRNAVIADPASHYKASIRSEKMLAKLVLLDAGLAIGVSPEVTAASGCDALCQAIESYTSRGANPLTDGMALEAVRLAATALPRAFANGSDLQAREAMGIAALLSGITLGNAGLGAVHGFAAPVGGHYPVPHGVVCAILLPLVMEANIRRLRGETAGAGADAGAGAALDRYATVCRVLIADPAAPALDAIDRGLTWIRSLTHQLRIPRLSAYGFTPQAIPAMVQLAQKASSMRYNPVSLSDQELADILGKAL